jgi:hypothetical protein
MPDFVIQEAEIDRKLLGNDVYCKYNLAGLMRGDALARAQALQIQRQNGVINADDWAELEDYDPPAGGVGRHYIVPANMQILGEPPPAAAS